MRIYDNGKYRDTTPEEDAEFEALSAAAPMPEPTAEEKMAALLAAIEGGLSDA